MYEKFSLTITARDDKQAPKDIGHEEAEKAISQLEKQFKDIYSQANSEVQEKMNKYLEQFKKQDEKNLKLVSEGKMSEEEYQKWRQNRVFAGKQWQARLNTLAEDYTHANRLAINAINGALPEIYADNFNYAAYLTEQQVRTDLSYQLVDRWTVQRLVKDNPQLLPSPSVNIPKDKRWNKQKIMSAVTQGIIQGESMQKIARRLKKVTDMNSASAIRNARTAVTGAECAGRVDSYKAAESKGVQMVQVWRATLDGRTRHSHAAMDGEEIEPGGTFSNGCQYPGDPHGEPSEVYNCRCTILGHVKGYEKYHQRGTYGNGKLGDESYDEWKARHKAALEKSSNSGRNTLTNGDGSGKINSRRASVLGSDGKTKHYAHKIGRVDVSNKEDVDKLISKFEKRYVESAVEHCLIICPNGDTYVARGDKYGVETGELLGDRIKGCFTTHNHPRSTTQYSFSEEDFLAAIFDSGNRMEAFDYKYKYEADFLNKLILEDELRTAYSNSKDLKLDLLDKKKIGFDGYEENQQHVIIEDMCKQLGIKYTRRKRND